MKHPERVEDYLEHIVEAIEMAIRYLAPMRNLEELRESRQTQDAIVRNIQIIGEAVSQIQRMHPDFAARHPEIPWPQMRGMRNVVVHEYFFVDLKLVWTTVTDDLPRLKQQITSLLTERRREREGGQEHQQGQ